MSKPGLILFYATVFFVSFAALAQQLPQSSSATGSWNFTFTDKGLKKERTGILKITEKDGKYMGTLQFRDPGKSSPIFQLNKVASANNRLRFSVEEGPYAPMRADLKLIDGKWAGQMAFEIHAKDNYKGIGLFVATPQSEGSAIDHALVIQHLDEKTMQKGKKLYDQVCAACHGANGISNLPAARSFSKDKLKYGSDPYSLWKTITNGAGQMGAQKWLSPEDAYAVIQYIREDLIKGKNPQSYFKITNDYLKGLPRPSMSLTQLENTIRDEALSGSQAYGQMYFQHHLGNYGSAMYASVDEHANDDIVINLSDSLRIAYNVQRMAVDAVWQGELNLSDTKYQKYRGDSEPSIAGHIFEGLDRMRWSYQDRYQQLNVLVSDRSPFPRPWLDYHGHYQYGDTAILSYSIMGRDVLEMPSAGMVSGTPVIQQTLKISPGSWQKLVLAGLGDRKSQAVMEGVFPLGNIDSLHGLKEQQWTHPEQSIIMTAPGNQGKVKEFVAVGIQGDTEGMRWVMENGHQLALYISPSQKSQTIRIYRISGYGISQLEAFAGYVTRMKSTAIPDLNKYIQGGNRKWNQTIVTQGKLDVGRPRVETLHYYDSEDHLHPTGNLVTIPKNYPYAVDQITLPFNNPWNSWIRPGDFDFFKDGRLVLCTYVGDVWLATGIDNSLKNIRWQRIATGLYDPFGVKVKDGEIYVTCRDRIVRLKDLNGDGETDFYETFHADTDVSGIQIQAYNYSLEVDKNGNFVYSKGGEYTNDDEPGNLIRVSPDGKTQESIATGFRAPNGVTITPDDQIFVSDNQGNWMPANKINLIRKGGFYGYVPTIDNGGSHNGPKEYKMKPDLAAPNYPDQILPDTFDQPIIWMPQNFDNSPGNGAKTPKDWGPMGGQLIWTSYGKGWAYQVLTQEVDGVTQAAVAALPFQFDAGTQRARINPHDGQYYLAGVTGWDDGFALKYGSLDRIRYKGGQESIIIKAVNVLNDGIEITFNNSLDPKTIKPGDFQIEQWNYQWAERYGSDQWSVKNPDKKGHDVVEVQSVELSSGGKTIRLKLKKEDLVPVNQMQIHLSVRSKENEAYEKTIYLTIHKVPENAFNTSSPKFKLLFGIILVGGIITISMLIYRKKNSQ